MIANFLYMHGVEFEYERPYPVDLATPTRSQYRPDFYYPAADIWHEHWAVDIEGNPPPDFAGYRDGMEWKRRIHSEHDTTLVESSWGDVMYGNGLERLQRDLEVHGVALQFDANRPIPERWAVPIDQQDLARLVRTFMQHVKSAGLNRDELERRAWAAPAPTRSRVFLDIFWSIYEEWNLRLRRDDLVDFEDMLVRASEHLRDGAADTPYDLVLVDEFQDASQARARLVGELLREQGRHLLAVGDDWQSINRFAGADLSVMTGFNGWFGEGPQMALTATFRCTQTISDAARGFVTANPAQLDKPMRSAQGHGGAPLVVIATDDPATALHDRLDELAATQRQTGTGPVTVFVLGRYRFDEDVMPERTWAELDVSFTTVHASKGLEADYVILPKMSTGTYGFPSQVADDPVLDLVMPATEPFAHAEERRLLYVALTRAKQQVTLLTDPDRPSPFVAELLKGKDGTITSVGFKKQVGRSCPDCDGHLLRRQGKHGEFLGCSAYPTCTFTESILPKDDSRERCPRCNRGTIIRRDGQYGPFRGCTSFPRCRYTEQMAGRR